MSWLFASGDQNTGASVPLVQRRTNNLNVWSHQDHNKGDISSPKGKVGCYYQKKKKRRKQAGHLNIFTTQGFHVWSLFIFTRLFNVRRQMGGLLCPLPMYPHKLY